MTVYTSGYTSGNLEAFARPRKPEGVDDKTAWLIGSGISSLAAAVFLIRDGHMKGDKITILEQDPIVGGALDGRSEKDGWVIRGGRELEDHYECLWDLFRSIPSLELKDTDPDASVLDEFYWLNQEDPNVSHCRITHRQGVKAETHDHFHLSAAAQADIQSLFLAPASKMQNQRIEEVVSEEFFESDFWIYWQTMFGYEKWHSALEMKLYIHRFIHHIDGLPDMSALKFTRYNQYESFVEPLLEYLKGHGVTFKMGTTVTDIEFSPCNTQATRIVWKCEGQSGGVDLGTNDLVFITNGSIVENSDNGSLHRPAKLKTGPAPAWDLWRRIAARSPDGYFGRPEVFAGDINQTKFESCTVTTRDKRIHGYIRDICGREPLTGKVVTGGIVTAKDSKWMISWTVNRQPHFKGQDKEDVVVWVYGLLVDVEGDYTKKPMQGCTGEEIMQEWLYHVGAPVELIPELTAEKHTKAVPTIMPYVTSLFMPRKDGDRVPVIPEGAKNFSFLGQFAQSKSNDCIFTTEYSARTAMEAVYGHLKIKRGIPEVWASTYDVRAVFAGISAMRDGEPFRLPGPAFLTRWALKLFKNTSIVQLMASENLLHREDVALSPILVVPVSDFPITPPRD